VRNTDKVLSHPLESWARPPINCSIGGSIKKFFAHLLNKGNPLDAKLQGNILLPRYFDELADDDRGKKKDYDIDNIVGMMHG